MAALEDNGYGDTDIALDNRIAIYLSKSPNNEINDNEFVKACYACNVDPNSITQDDIRRIQKKLNEIA